MNQPIDELYFQWLCNQVGLGKTKKSSKTHWNLLKQLFKKEFIWIVPNDDNRVEDGRDLRYEFIDDNEIEEIDQAWMEMGCSFLEMLIALSRRLSFETGQEPTEWFWIMLYNLRLSMYNDVMELPYKRIDSILETVIWRTFQKNGRGGIFPLKRYSQDQRAIEIWYQASNYLTQNQMV